MTTRKPKTTNPVTQATKAATIPKRQVIKHTALFRAELQVKLRSLNDALAAADRDLTNAASERDVSLEANRRDHEAKDALATQRYETIRSEVDEDRNDILLNIEGVEAALAATGPAQSNVVAMAAE
jgi:hypothetical protein